MRVRNFIEQEAHAPLGAGQFTGNYMDRNFSLNDVLVNAKIEAYQKGIYQPLPIPTEEDSGKILYADNLVYALKALPEITFNSDQNISVISQGDYDKIIQILLNKNITGISSIILDGSTTITEDNQVVTKKYVDDLISEIDAALTRLNSGEGVQ